MGAFFFAGVAMAILRPMEYRFGKRFATAVRPRISVSPSRLGMTTSLAAMLIGVMVVLAIVGVIVSAHWTPYFPLGSLDSSDGSDQRSNRWYSSQLAAMEEPVLHSQQGVTVYRFTWLRSFHHPIAVRVESDHGQAEFSAVEMSGFGGYGAGHPMRRVRGPVTRDQFEAIQALMEEKGFWTLRPYESTNGRDGAEWIVEGASEHRYRVVTRWSPGSGPIREIGWRLLSMTGWTFPADEIY